MIRINLLPFRSDRKKDNVKRQLVLFFICVLVLAGVMAGMWYRKLAQCQSRANDVQNAQTELASYEADIKEAKKVEEALNLVKQKKEVISQLNTSRSGPVRILDSMTKCIVAKKMWFVSLKNDQAFLDIKGTAMDNSTVAQFMRNLESAQDVFFKDVSLMSSRQTELGVNKMKLQEFQIRCQPMSEQTKTTTAQANK
ncbi:MAG: PilN domain-containing protein [Pseudomonadota bacterium]